MNKLTLETLLQREQDGVLLDIQLELLSNVVPATGYAHAYCRKVNKLIDAGECCINPNTYRRVYLPTLAKAVQRELSRRYTQVILGRRRTTKHVPQADQMSLFQEGYLQMLADQEATRNDDL